jgi:diphthamide synthase (EF-2-diphthine--ammonia ligase)
VIGLRLPDFNDLENNFLCQRLDSEHLIELENRNIDPLGEDGEYQSLVIGCVSSKKILKIKDSEIKTEKGRDTKNYAYTIQEITDWEITSS